MAVLPLLWPETSMALVVTTSVITTVAALSLLRWTFYPVQERVIASPLKTVIPKLSRDEIAQLDYTPDAFPGARDVDTPYGSIRVYEFGPLDGPKVAFIHGISTSCQTLTYLAHGLAARGCRVLLFDLFGRGFSDGVGDLPHDGRLYTSQLLLTLASSPLAWSGTAAFDLVGYSLGGGVAVQFAAAFPALVRRLVLLAPAGLIRPEAFGAATVFVFRSGWVPPTLLSAITKRRLRTPIARSARKAAAARTAAPPPAEQQPENPLIEADPPSPIAAAAAALHSHLHNHHHAKLTSVDLLTGEVDDPHSGPSAASKPPETPLHERVMRYVRWMLDRHAGFVPAFTGCIRDAPLVGQHAAWAALAARRPPGSVCVVLGGADEIVDADAYAADGLPLLGGRDRVAWVVVPGAGHDFPMTHPAEAIGVVGAFLGVE